MHTINVSDVYTKANNYAVLIIKHLSILGAVRWKKCFTLRLASALQEVDLFLGVLITANMVF